MSKMLTIIVPAYNEEEVLHIFYERIREVMDNLECGTELLFVNDGSSDATLEIIKDLKHNDNRVSYVDLSRNFGKEVAMAAGIDYASGEAVVLIDADLQDPPELIYQMVEKWNEGYDDIYAKRTSRKGETFVKKSTSYSFYWLLSKISPVSIQRNTGDFRLLNKKALKSLRSMRETQRYSKGLFSLIGHKKYAIEFVRDSRVAGKSKWNYYKLIDLAIEGITSFTTSPLRLATFVGLVFSVASFSYLIYIIISTLIYGNDVPGYPSLLSIILFLGGLQLISIGIIGEYIGRIFMEVKQRPLYFINEYNNENVAKEQF